MLKTVYNQKYYRVQALLKKSDFQKHIQWLKDQFDIFNISIPKKGFKKYQEYLDWNKKFWDKFTESQKSEQYIHARSEIINDKGVITGDENIARMYEIEDTLLPPIYGSWIIDLIQEYGFDRKDKDLKKFLISYIFMGQKEYQEQPLRIVHKIDNKTKKAGLFVQIYPWTTKDDLNNCWKDIKEEQSYYPEYIERNRPWKEFDRDVEIYEFYKNSLERVQNEDIKAADIDVFSKLHQKYPELTLSGIRKICERTRERLGEKTGKGNA